MKYLNNFNPPLVLEEVAWPPTVTCLFGHIWRQGVPGSEPSIAQIPWHRRKTAREEKPSSAKYSPTNTHLRFAFLKTKS